MQLEATENYGMLARFLPMVAAEFPESLEGTEEPSVSAYRVLIVEPSASLAKLLATGLSAESLAVDVTYDFEGAMRRLESRAYHLLILDLDLAEADRSFVLESLRAKGRGARVVVLSGRSGVDELVTALDHGADDYLLKPFSLIELMARVRALRRRTDSGVPASAPRTSKLVLHKDQCRVDRDGRAIDLTPREFALLECLMQNAGKTLSRSMLTQEVWNMPAEANTNIVDVYIKYLRDKLDGAFEEKLIRTVRGMGYLFQSREAA